MTATGHRPTPPPVGTPSEDDIPRLIATMIEGFSTDPLYLWLYPHPTLRRTSLRATFGLMLGRGLARGHVRCTEDRRAVAIWPPPAVDLLGEDDLDDWVRRLRGEAPDRVDEAVAAMAACAAHAPGEPHWVLHSVVVAPDRQGRGQGTALLRSTLREVDISGAPGYLESSTIRNVRAYQRLGFRVRGTVAIPHGPTMRPMTRPSARSGR